MRSWTDAALELLGRAWLARAAVVFALAVAWSFATAAALDRIRVSVGVDGEVAIPHGALAVDVEP